MIKKQKSYMELAIHLDGKESVYLKVPTLWDDVEKQWIGFIKTPITNKLISATGKNSFELQNNFNNNVSKMMQASEEMGQEIFSMFMPSFYWEE